LQSEYTLSGLCFAVCAGPHSTSVGRCTDFILASSYRLSVGFDGDGSRREEVRCGLFFLPSDLRRGVLANCRFESGGIELCQKENLMPNYVPLPGSRRSLLPKSRPAGPIDPSEIVSVTVRVRSSGNPKALAARAYDLANTKIADRKYMTHPELEKEY